MRNKFKIIASLLVFLVAFFYSCEKDLYEDQNYQSKIQQQVSVKKISYKKFKSNRKAVEELKSALAKKNPLALNSRVVYDEEFEMYVDTTNIIVNETPESETITMSVLSEEDLTKVENLILVLTDDGSYKAFISEYTLTQTQIDILASGGTLDNVIPTSITDLDTSSKMSVSSNCVDVSSVTYSTCTDANGNTIIHQGDNNPDECVADFGGSITYEVVNINMSCLADGGGGGSTTTSGDSGSTGTSTGTSGTTGSGPTGGSTSTGSNSTIYDSVIELLNTTFVSPCIDCIEFSSELSEFISNLSLVQLSWWDGLDTTDKKKIVNYFIQNNYSEDSIAFFNLAFVAIMNNEVENFQEFLFDFTSDTWDEDDNIAHKNKLCGSYNFVTVGNASVANISGLGMSVRRGHVGMNIEFLNSLCVTIPYTAPSQASSVFNTAWNVTINEVFSFLNATYTITSPSYQELKSLLIEFLSINIALMQPGSTISTNPCIGSIPHTPAVYCP